MPEREDFLRLIAELEQDIEVLDRLEEQHGKAVDRIKAGARDVLDYAALGYTIHNLYSLFENYALRVAKTFENHIEQETWHRELVRRMTLEIPDVRPRLWDQDLALHIDELRRFRHAFRHVYETELQPPKIMLTQAHIDPAIEGFRVAHAAFLEKLQLLVKRLT